MMHKKIDDLICILRQSPQMENVFNPWRDVDAENDIDSNSPEIRTEQLSHYLGSRIRSARYIIIGEAMGYQGGHFSGIAMTSERMLLGLKKTEGIHPEDVLPGIEPQRTSKPDIMAKGFSEPTATIVWGTLLNHGVSARQFVLWNAFPWHPYNAGKGLLSNRRPTGKELKDAYAPLQKFLKIFPFGAIIALGKISSCMLGRLGIECFEVRHPANGGAGKFRRQVLKIIKKND